MKVILLLLSLAAVTLAQTEWVSLGNPDFAAKGRCKTKTDKGCDEYEAPVDTVHAFRCISKTPKTKWKKVTCGLGTYYAQSRFGNKCLTKNFADAQKVCADEGARIPTLAEVNAKCTVGSGCYYDYRHVWAIESKPTTTSKPTSSPAGACERVIGPVLCVNSGCRWVVNHCETACEGRGQNDCGVGCKWETGSCKTVYGWCPPVFNKQTNGQVIGSPSFVYVRSSAECRYRCDLEPDCDGFDYNDSMNKCYRKSGVTTQDDEPPVKGSMYASSKTCINSGCIKKRDKTSCEARYSGCRWFADGCYAKCEFLREAECGRGCKWTGTACKALYWCPAVAGGQPNGNKIPFSDTKDYYFGYSLARCEKWCDVVAECNSYDLDSSTRRCTLYSGSTDVSQAHRPGVTAAARSCGSQLSSVMITESQGSTPGLGRAVLNGFAAIGVLGLLYAGYNALARNKGYDAI